MSVDCNVTVAVPRLFIPDRIPDDSPIAFPLAPSDHVTQGPAVASSATTFIFSLRDAMGDLLCYTITQVT
ncbi:MAG: hypothetical protein AB4352_27000 [Hormoscilla sp.]